MDESSTLRAEMMFTKFGVNRAYLSVEGRNQLKNDELNEKQRKAGIHLRPTAVEKVVTKGKENFFTIGYGHYLDNSKEAIAAFKKAWGPPRDDPTDDDLLDEPTGKKGWATKRWELQHGIGTIPEDVVEKLLDFDITRKIKTAKRIFGTKVFNEFPQAVRDAVINGVFRGEFTPNQTTVKLLKKGDYAGAAKNYIDREDYRAALPYYYDKRGIRRKKKAYLPGVAIRMDRKNAVFLSMAKLQETDPNRKGYFRLRSVAGPVEPPVAAPAAAPVVEPAGVPVTSRDVSEQIASMDRKDDLLEDPDLRDPELVRQEAAAAKAAKAKGKADVGAQPGSSDDLQSHNSFPFSYLPKFLQDYIRSLSEQLGPNKVSSAEGIGYDPEGVQLANAIINAPDDSYNPYDHGGASSA